MGPNDRHQYKGVLNTTAGVLPFMIKQKSGHVVNTSSIAGLKVFPGLSVYSATKHADTALSDGMRMEFCQPRRYVGKI
ncbi:SDR family oxidoreductase [Rhizobium sp. Rhizsp82]|uniref:SDR family oxidoreductase n=1 Tax=Rhizobium sp. Rhizsp82 TaxID=3243057 RepID=UPI0039B41A4C